MAEKIFISYAQKDRNLLEALEKKLHEYFKSEVIFNDLSHIHPGENWREAIKNQIQSASKIVILATDESASSQWVNYEAGMADALGKPIIIAVAKGSTKNKYLLSMLDKMQVIEF